MGTMVFPSLMALHTHPRYWGEDSLIWRPSRWIISSASNKYTKYAEKDKTQMDHEVLITPAKGSYIPWSDGSRNCPGKKFSQVEFVAVMACLFRDHCLRPTLLQGESLERAQDRVLQVVADSKVGLLLQMRDPSLVAVVWEKQMRM